MKTKLLCCLIAVLAFGCGGNDDETMPLEQKTSKKRPRAQVASADSNATANTDTTTSINPQAVEVYKWTHVGSAILDTSEVYMSGDGEHIYLKTANNQLFHKKVAEPNGVWDSITLLASIGGGEDNAEYKPTEETMVVLPTQSGLVIACSKNAAQSKVTKMFVVVGNRAAWGMSASKHHSGMINGLPTNYQIDMIKVVQGANQEFIQFIATDLSETPAPVAPVAATPKKSPTKKIGDWLKNSAKKVNLKARGNQVVTGNAGFIIKIDPQTSAVDVANIDTFADVNSLVPSTFKATDFTAQAQAIDLESRNEMMVDRAAVPNTVPATEIQAAFGDANLSIIRFPNNVYVRRKGMDLPRP